MKTALLLIVVFFSLLLINHVVYAQSSETDGTTKKLHVSFINNIAPSYEVKLDPNEKFIISQSYSWVRDQNSRYNLVSYSIDDGDPTSISRLARGNFTLDISTVSSHSIVFMAAIQYPIAVDGVNIVSFLPSSPTNDNWFDAGSKVSIKIQKIQQIDEKTREVISGWSVDKSTKRLIPEDDSDFFITPTLRISDMHAVDFYFTTQYWLDVVSQYGSTQGYGWYDEGSTVTVTVIPSEQGLIGYELVGWEGPILESKGNSAKIVVNSPSLVKAKWSVNYLSLSLIIIVPIVAVVAFFAIRGKVSKKSHKAVQAPYEVKQDSDNYYIEIQQYLEQKTLEKLEDLLRSDIVTEDRNARIKEKLEFK